MRAKILVFLLIFGVLTSATVAQKGKDHLVEEKVINWIKENAIPIKSVNPDSFEDISVLSDIFDDKNLILLGEGTHGTKEFFLIKDKIIRYLIANKDFKNLGMEYDMVDGLPMQKYIQSGVGDSETALSQQRGWVWNTKEVLDMGEWLRDQNKLRDEKINYYGIDMLRFLPPFTHSINFLKSQNITESTYIEKKMQELMEINNKNFKEHNENFYAKFSGDAPIENNYKLKELMLLLIDLFDIHKDMLIKQTSPDVWEMNRQIALTAFQKSRHHLQWNMNNIFPTFGRKKQNEIYGRAKSVSVRLKTFYEINDPVQYENIKTALDLIENPYAGNPRYLNLTIPERGKLKESILSAIERLSIRKVMYVENVNERKLDEIRSDLRLILDIFEIYTNYLSKPALGTNEREIGLAENAGWLFTKKGKTIVWAHNLHVSKKGNSETDMMGTILKKKFDDQMLVIGTTFNKGKFQASYSVKQTNANTSQLREFEIGESKKDSIENLMAQVGYPIFLIDFRKLPESGIVKEWFSKKHYLRSIGNSYNPEKPDNYYEFIEIPKHYDAMIFFNQTTRATPTKYIINKYKLE